MSLFRNFNSGLTVAGGAAAMTVVAINALSIADLHRDAATLSGENLRFDDSVSMMSQAAEDAVSATTEVHGAYARGIATGFHDDGRLIPDDLLSRVQHLVSEDIIQGNELLADANKQGQRDALTGDWTIDRLDSYVISIESYRPVLEIMARESYDDLRNSGLDDDASRLYANFVPVIMFMEFAGRDYDPEARRDELNLEMIRERGSEDAVAAVEAYAQSAQTWSHSIDKAGDVDNLPLREVARDLFLERAQNTLNDVEVIAVDRVSSDRESPTP